MQAGGLEAGSVWRRLSTHHSKAMGPRHMLLFKSSPWPRHVSPEIAATVTGKFKGPSDSWSAFFTHPDDHTPVTSQPKGRKGFG